MLLRIYVAFFFEGVKIFQRYILALLKLNEERLLKCSSKEEAEHILCGTKRGNATEMNVLTKMAFRLSMRFANTSIHQYSSYDIPTPYLAGVKLQRFYRPRLIERSGILVDSEWEVVWSWIPHKSRILVCCEG